MKKYLIFAVFVLALLAVCGCSATVSGGYGEPINDLAEAVAEGDTEDYLDVFEDKYIEDLEEYYNIISDNGLHAAVKEILDGTKEYNKENCGGFTSISVTEVSKEQLDDFPADAVYTGDFEPDGKVEKIYEITVSYVIEGLSGSTEPKEAELIVYSVDGEYYLHPMHLLFVFQ